MKSQWMLSRTNIFVRNLLQEYCDASLRFKKIYTDYKNTRTVSYDMLAEWVGNENCHGPLWELKDISHRLFRNDERSLSLYEIFFDWTIGSIFHQVMKLKEDAYQIDSYLPLLKPTISHEMEENTELLNIINENISFMEKTVRDLSRQLNAIHKLFSKAVYHLREVLICHKNNPLLLRFIADNEKTVSNVLGYSSVKVFYKRLFSDDTFRIYIIVAGYCAEAGRYREGLCYLEKVLKSDRHNKQASALRDELLEKSDD